ncbi:MAG TPA: thioredoxin family protein [Patescibacteria group bacterium]|nr:thioredoxin family protein [Patescibacteria group bacterium]
MKILNNIDEMKSIVANHKIALLYITSESCNVCKVIFPRLKSLLESFPEIKAVRADIQELPLLSGEYNIFTIPCILAFAEGKEILREARYIDLEKLRAQLERTYQLLFEE